MSEDSAFNRRQIEDTAVGPQPGLLEQMNLPPGLISFLRTNQRLIWTIVAVVALVVTAVSIYNTYTTYRERKAASALTLAMQAEEGQKFENLQEVVDEYGSTSSALWARVEMAHLVVEEERLADAVSLLTGIREDISARNPLTPLILFNLANVYEKEGDLEQAAAVFQELTSMEGFASTAYLNLGRIFELQEKKGQAVEMYEKYLAMSGEGGEGLPGAAPDRQIIESRITLLQQN